jgi:hypothetical protein
LKALIETRRARCAYALLAIASASACASTRHAATAETKPLRAEASTYRNRVLELIAAARTERGLPPVGVISESEPLAAAEREILRGVPPDQAIRTAIQRVVDGETSEADGWCIETHDVERIELPSVILERHEVFLSVRTIQKPAGAAPPLFVVCLLVFEEGPEIPSTDG